MSWGNRPDQVRRAAGATIDRHGARLLEADTRLRIQIDAQLVGVLGVGAAHLPWMQRDRAHLRRPHDRRGVGHLQRVGGSSRRECHPAGLQIVGMMLRHPLLIDLFAVDAVREALQVGRPVAQCVQHRAAGQGQVVLDEPPLGAVRPEFGEIHLVRVGQPDRDAVDVELFCCGSHIRIPARPGGR